MKHAWILIALTTCLRPSEDHAQYDREVGRAELPTTLLFEEGGLAAVRHLGPEEGSLWAASPILHLRVRAAGSFRLTVHNVLPDSVAVLDDGRVLTREPDTRPTVATFILALSGTERTLRLAPPDADVPGTYRVAVLSDVQEAIGDVRDIYDRMRADPEIRFVLSTGDLTQNGGRSQLLQFQEELEHLPVPLYSTVGNHEVPGPDGWHDLFGPFSSFFRYRGVAFSLVDSSNATIDPSVLEDRLQPWIDAHADAPHLFLTHVPIFDASGLRSGAFRSRNEAARLVQRLAAGDVDALFFGHVHSYYAYSLGGIDTYISGGGGAIEEQLDGIARHYLTVDLDPMGVQSVGLVRIE